MTTTSPLLVTGAGGQLGRRVLELLLQRGAGPLIGVTRRPEALADLASRGVEVRAGDFDQESGLAAAFRGARRALLISTDALDRPGRRLAQHRAAVRALVEAGAEHVVYTSIVDPIDSPIAVAPDHAGTEAALAASPLDFTVLRNNVYADLLLLSLPAALASGRLVDARGEGRTAYVTREDCARTAAAALASGETGRRYLDVTGPESVSSAELAAMAGELARRPVTHLSVPVETLIAGMVEHGMPRPIAELYASFDVGIARGQLAGVSDTVERLTGSKPQRLLDFLGGHRAALAGG